MAGTTFSIAFNFDSHIQKITWDTYEWSTSGEYIGVPDTIFVTTSILQVYLDSGYVVDTVSSRVEKVTDTTIRLLSYTGTYTLTSKSSGGGGTSMNFKHFYDAGTIGTGTIKFRHYSQTEPSSGETWVLNDTLTGSTLEDITVPTFVSNGHTFQYLTWNNETYVIKLTYIDREDRDNDVTVYYGDDDHDFKGWLNQAYRTITFSTSPTGDLLTWLQANGTKQGGGGGAVTGIT